MNHLITMDLHQREIHGFFDCSVDNLRSSPFLLQHILDHIPNYKDAVLVARHPSATRRVSSYAERLQINFAVVHGEEKDEPEKEEDGRTSPPPTPSGLPLTLKYACTYPSPIPNIQQKIKPKLSVVGSVTDKVSETPGNPKLLKKLLELLNLLENCPSNTFYDRQNPKISLRLLYR